MTVYSITDFLKTKKTIKEEIAAYQAIIDAMMEKILEGVEVANLHEYQLNDGQTIIRVMYRSQTEMMTAIRLMEQRINSLRNQGIGRRNKLRDKDTLH